MKRIALILLVVAGIATTIAFNNKENNTAAPNSGESIEFFQGTFAEALAYSKLKNKPIFMDSYTTWCHWCKVLDNTTFKDTAVIQYLNANFVNVKMNMEKGEGPALAQEFNVSGYPTLLFLDYDREVIGTIGGYVKSDVFLSEAKKAVEDF